ncbi:MAG: addiction module protein [Sporichthyaceae bacterium]
MTTEAQDLLRTALMLPAGDRAELVAGLLESLEAEADAGEHVFSEAWRAEIETRARRAMSEPATSDLAWDDVRAEITARLRSR